MQVFLQTIADVSEIKNTLHLHIFNVLGAFAHRLEHPQPFFYFIGRFRAIPIVLDSAISSAYGREALVAIG